MKETILIPADFKWGKNDPEKFKKYANITCKFTSQDKSKTVVTQGYMVTVPYTQEEGKQPDHIKCRSPVWGNAEAANLEISVNNQDYKVNFQFTFTEPLDLLRIAPMAGPVEGKTQVKLYGQGFNMQKAPVHIRWGVH